MNVARRLIGLLILFSPLAQGATVKGLNKAKGRLVLSVSEEELTSCKKDAALALTDDQGAFIGAYRVKIVSKKQLSVVIEVGDDLSRFKSGMKVHIESQGEDDPGTAATAFDASDAVRGERRWGASVAGGRIIGKLLGGGVEAMWNWTPKLQLGASLMLGSYALDAEETSISRTDPFELRGRLILLRARYFVWSAVNVGVGLGMRNLVVEHSIKSTSTPDRIDSTLVMSSAVGQVTVGGHWLFANGIWLGVDVVGLVVPFTTSSRASTYTEGAVSSGLDDDHRRNQKTAEEIGRNPNDQLLVVSLGYFL